MGRYTARWLALFAATILTFSLSTSCSLTGNDNSGPIFRISFAPELEDEPVDGRLLLLISNDDSAEPRFQISDRPHTQLAFGIDVDGERRVLYLTGPKPGGRRGHGWTLRDVAQIINETLEHHYGEAGKLTAEAIDGAMQEAQGHLPPPRKEG